jgi:hypothetical protein
MLTPQDAAILEQAWTILDQHRHTGDFNESHDLTLSDGARVISEFLNYQNQLSGNQHTARLSEQLRVLESFRNL